MRPIAFALCLATALAACSIAVRKNEEPAAPRDIARSEPGKKDEPTKVFDEATRRAALAKRFPGSRSIDLVRVLAWTEDRAGACWTEMSTPWNTKIDARYAVDGKQETASSMKDLRDQGWLMLYRTPNGSGFERRGAFDSIDLTLSTDYVCRCAAAPAVAPAESRLPVTLRLRWQGRDRMPEASAAVEKEGKKQGLLVAFAPGNLLAYEFPVRGSYPGERGGTCGGTIAVSLLSTPPMQ